MCIEVYEQEGAVKDLSKHCPIFDSIWCQIQQATNQEAATFNKNSEYVLKPKSNSFNNYKHADNVE